MKKLLSYIYLISLCTLYGMAEQQDNWRTTCYNSTCLSNTHAMRVVVSLDMRKLEIISTQNNEVPHILSISEERKHFSGFKWSTTDKYLAYSITNSSPESTDFIQRTCCWIYNLETRKHISLEGSGVNYIGAISKAAWGSDETFIAIPSNELSLGIWKDLSSGQISTRINYYDDDEGDYYDSYDSLVNFIDFLEISPNNNYVAATLNNDDRIRIWNISTRRRVTINNGLVVEKSIRYNSYENDEETYERSPFTKPIQWSIFPGEQ